jgi:hypothetical protein
MLNCLAVILLLLSIDKPWYKKDNEREDKSIRDGPFARRPTHHEEAYNVAETDETSQKRCLDEEKAMARFSRIVGVPTAVWWLMVGGSS